MNRKELIADMQNRHNSGFMNRREFADYMGYKDAHYVGRYIEGLDRVGGKYFIPDLADAILMEGRK